MQRRKRKKYLRTEDPLIDCIILAASIRYVFSFFFFTPLKTVANSCAPIAVRANFGIIRHHLWWWAGDWRPKLKIVLIRWAWKVHKTQHYTKIHSNREQSANTQKVNGRRHYIDAANWNGKIYCIRQSMGSSSATAYMGVGSGCFCCMSRQWELCVQIP